MLYKVKKESAFDFFVIPVSDRMIWVLQGPFYGFGGVVAEAFAAFRADERGASSRGIRGESVHDDIFNPIRVITRTAAVFVPIARPCERFVRLWLQWFLAHLATPQIIRTL